jgi:hypothetical protein
MDRSPSGTSPLPSNRSFGMLFVAVFAALGGYSRWRGGTGYPGWFAAAALVLVPTVFAPRMLTPFNRAWMKLGHLLGRVFNPVVLGLLFFLGVTPLGIVKRMLGWDPMRTRYDADAATYWIDRDPPGPAPDSLPNQF